MGEFWHGSATKKGATILGLALLTACVAPTSNLPTVSQADAQAEAHKQRVIAIRERDEQARRLSRVSVPILAANTEQCGSNLKRRSGVNFKSVLLNTSADVRRAAIEARGLARAGEVRVDHTVPGMPADGVLFPDDILTRINGVSAYGAVYGNSQLSLQARQFKVSLKRDGQPIDVSMPTVPVCSYRVVLVANDTVNAFAGNNTIVFTTGFMRLFDSDQDLALAFGHEMAHLTRDHQTAKKTNEMIGAMIAAIVSGVVGVNVVDIGAKIGRNSFSQEFESEADYVGMYHASRAGWNMTGAGNMFRRMAAADPGSIHLAGSTHPSTASRAVLVEQTALEITNKRNQNLALIPNFKGQPPTSIPLDEPTLAARPPSITGPASALRSNETSAIPDNPVNAEQQYRLAVQYEAGTDQPQDYAAAVKWYRKAADQGHRSALYNLGMMYVNGHGVRQNNGEAVIYFRRAAELKHAKAHFNLGFMQENGRGVAKSPSLGLTSYMIALNLGLGDVANDARSRLATGLSTAQVSEAERRAQRWMDEHRR